MTRAGNNRPDIEILPDLADVFQVSIDSLLGYEKAYKHLDKFILEVEEDLKQEKYDTAIERLSELIRSYPNDFRTNHLMGDAYYSKIVSGGASSQTDIDKAIFFYEKSIELFEEKYSDIATIEALEMQIVTLLLWKDTDDYDEAYALINKYNQSGKYDYLLAQCLFQMGKKDEAMAVTLHHCIAGQIFVFNDLSRIADMYVQEAEYEKAIEFLECEIASYCLFMDEENGSYADRAYAGKAEIISSLYKKAGKNDCADKWHREAVMYSKKLPATMNTEKLSMSASVVVSFRWGRITSPTHSVQAVCSNRG